ncbi:hypothetical protein Nepgr_023872 [Nepenthes gracilis]|uniref:FAD-binding PCMH-type domain-containing protein n=1 Tax=Nepenthes gracilis TaxID=150966 RepID=A0AAD3T3J7_NEPGR|nr:hypothetical protein Nepgr_023872 [Nepenthes gracilis]
MMPLKSLAFRLLRFTLLFAFFAAAASKSPSSSPTISEFLKCLEIRDPNSSIPISKSVYLRGDPSFPSILQSYIRNRLFNRSTTPKPRAIATVVCAKSNGLELRIRSGGHDYEGLSYVSPNPNFIVLDLSGLRAITVDATTETAWAQAGATLGELNYKIANKSRCQAFPAGVCPSIAVGGHIGGGGYGNMQRKYGLSVDNVIDARVVLADGRILDRRTMEEDLFWAIRGGGAASFCVVLAWRLKLVRVPETVTVFKVGRTLKQGATNIVDQWQQVAPNVDDNLFIRAQPHVQGVGNKTELEVLFYGQYLGPADSLTALVSEKFPLLGLRKDDCFEMPWLESTLFWFDLPKGTPTTALLQRVVKTSVNVKRKSDYVQKRIPKSGLEAIWKKMLQLGNVYMQWNPYGGKMSEIPRDAYLVIWFDDGVAAEKTNLGAVNALHEFMTPYVSSNPREAFLNYRDIDVGTNANGSLTFAKDYFKDNLNRLMKVKGRVDPDNFFRYEQSIPPIPK